MKQITIFIFLLFSLVSSKAQRTLDSLKYSYYKVDTVYYEVTKRYWSNGLSIDSFAMCGEGTDIPRCDSTLLAEGVMNASANAWKEWAGYKLLSRHALGRAKDMQRDGLNFFQTLTGSSTAFVKSQNDKYFPLFQGSYTIKTSDMPSTNYNLVQLPNGNCRFVMTNDTTINLNVILTSEASFRLREKSHAKATMVVTGVNPLAGDVITVNGSTLTEGINFAAVTNVTTTATNLAAAIDAIPNISASSIGAVVYLKADKPGNAGNSITMTYTQGTGNGLTLSGNSFSGGSNSVEEAHNMGLEDPTNSGKLRYQNYAGDVIITKKN